MDALLKTWRAAPLSAGHT